MEPKNRLSEIFGEIGLVPRPTDEMLSSWGMTLHRFNLLVQNRAKLPMSVSEMKDLKKWLQKNFKGRNAYLFEEDMPAELRNKQTNLNL
ncbi:hypothetical protein [Pontibacter mangrovi]|uniref:Uncharacterized protein n=1 Tax=Pontibacter mangrovi TaxID=2589816 RepID=A0A501W750_9BACT|nr:hypothetical protein [Pontibacter mangrovi]TPE43944.1 hypothetical protein FJM65_11000 [Pontibacter mangrovi]